MQPTSETPTLAESLQNRAVSLAKQGFRVFPLIVDGSTPAYEGWQDKATSDPDLARKLWSDPHGDPLPYNIGIRTGDGLTVLDVDTKRNRAGAESLDDLVTFQGLEDETFTVRTKSGGLHLYYRSADRRLKNSVGQIALGLDIRSDGGYVVAPGSTVGDLAYEVVKPLAIAAIQPWFAELCGTAQAKGESAEPLVELDTPDAIARAIDWLRNSSPLVIADSGNGDITAYKVACRLKDFGISEHECLSLILENYDEHRAHPPQGPEIWERKVENAYRHGTSAPGAKSPMADFEIEELEQPAAETSNPARPDGALPTYDVGQSLAYRADGKRPYLIKGFLGAGAMSVLFGPTNVGKTFVMLDIAFHVAAGLTWNGRRVTKSPVIYVASEGTHGIHDRVAAWINEHDVAPEDCWLTLVPCPVDLRSNMVDLKRLIAVIREKIAQWGASTPPMVVIDTYARAMAGGDENSATDAGLMVKHLDAVRYATGAHVVIIHHSGKDVTRGARGSTALPGAIDTEFVLTDGQIQNPKQRDGAKADPIPYSLKTVTLGVDEEGDPVTSCVVLYGAAAEMADTGETEELTTEQRRWLDALAVGVEALAQEAGNPVTEHRFTWQNAAAIWGGTPRMTRQACEKRLRALATKMQLCDLKKNQWVMA